MTTPLRSFATGAMCSVYVPRCVCRGKMRSKPLPPEPATSLTFDAVTTWPFGAVIVTLAGVSDENTIAWSNITRTLESVVAVGPLETADTTFGAGVVPGGGVPRV